MSKTVNSTPMLVNAMLRARMQQKGIEQDQNEALAKTKISSEEKVDVNQVDTIAKLIAQDASAIKNFNQSIEQCNPHYAIKNNKLSVVLNNSFSKFPSDHAISSVLSGKLPAGIDNAAGGTIPHLGSGEYYGGGNPLYVSALLHYASLTSGGNKPLYAIKADSALYHSNPLPDALHIESDLTWYDKTANALAVPHGGYAFGGHRYQKTDNAFAPEDCGTFLTKYAHPTVDTTVADLMCLWSIKKPYQGGWQPDDWGPKKLLTLYNAINPEEVQAGDVYFHKAERDTLKLTVYAPGYCAVTLSSGGQEVTTVSASRDLEREFNADSKPGIEGIGLQSFPMEAEKKIIAFLRPTDALIQQMPNTFGINGLDWSHEPVTEQKVVQYYDSHFGHGGLPLDSSLTGDSSASAATYD